MFSSTSTFFFFLIRLSPKPRKLTRDVPGLEARERRATVPLRRLEVLALGELHQLAAEVREPPVFEFCSGRTKKKSKLSLLRDLERLETWRGCCLRDDECDDGDDDRCRRFQRRRSFPKKTCPSTRRTLSTTTKVEKKGKKQVFLTRRPSPLRRRTHHASGTRPRTRTEARPGTISGTRRPSKSCARPRPAAPRF